MLQQRLGKFGYTIDETLQTHPALTDRTALIEDGLHTLYNQPRHLGERGDGT